MLDNIKQLKTKSYMDGDLKCWTITTPDGEVFDCQPVGQRYICCGFKGTLKAIKESIVDGGISLMDVVLGIEDEYEEHLVKQSETVVRDLWECVPLGALLIEHLGVEKCLNDPQIMESLGGEGWLLEGDDLDDAPHPIDMSRVTRAFARYQPPLEDTDDEDVDELADEQVEDEELEAVPQVCDSDTAEPSVQ